MKTIAALVTCFIALGTAAIWYGTTRSALQNNEAVHFAYPGVGFAVTRSFHLANSGRFALQMAIPATAQELSQRHREQPDVPCDLEVAVRGSGGFQISRRIGSFHNGGWSESNLFYPKDLFVLPRGGNYEIELQSRGGGDVFMRRGTAVTLQRWEDVGSALGWGPAIWIGYGSFACAGALSLFSFAIAGRTTTT